MKVLVYGWYNQGNIGDNLFVEAFHYLFPNFQFVFSETITADLLSSVDVVFLGGGSFLVDPPRATEDALQLLKEKKIFYLGVGTETNIHPIHIELIKRAQLIATRSIDRVRFLSSLNDRVRFIPDLVYALQSEVQLSTPIPRSVLIIPNIAVVPQRTDPHWKHVAWNYFKSEFTQFLDWLIDNNYHPHFFSMCNNMEMDDGWASTELICHMTNRSQDWFLKQQISSLKEVTALISQYETIITQRFHGIVLAEMTRVPYITIYHHDKLKLSSPDEGKLLSYYNSSKISFIEAFSQARHMNYSRVLPIETDTFKALVKEVISLI